MREYEFRAWHEEDKVMLYENIIGDVFRWKNENQPIKIMQYTGLKDKNGKKIFEGDIVKVDDSDDLIYWMRNEICQIKYAPGRFQLYNSDYNKNMMQEDIQEYVTLIGNICENTEIIKG